jgi:DNA polymerase-1
LAGKPVLYLLDASSYIHRAFHAIRGLSTSDGVPTNAVFGFTNMLLKVLREAQPEYLGVVYDAKGPTFRHKLYAAYKANRPPLDPALKTQFPLVRQVVTALDLPAVEMEGYEADDLMATLAEQAKEQGFEVILVSGDKDLYQLLGDAVTMWDTMKEARLGPKEVVQKLGVGPERVVDLMALTGDSTDNVPGVPGVGPKSAAKLLGQYADLDELLDQAASMKASKMRQNLIDFRDQALISRDLVRLAKDAPISFDPEIFKVTEPDPKVITPVLARLEFTKLMKEFAAVEPEPEAEYLMLTETEDIKKHLEAAAKAGALAVDTETTSTDPVRAKLVGYSFCYKPEEAYYVPVAHQLELGQRQADREEALAALAPLLADKNIAKTGQNIKYDIIVLERHGLPMAGVAFDTMVASYLLNPGKTSHGLAAIVAEFLGRGVISYEEAVGGKNKTFDLAPLEKAAPYAAEDAEVTFAAARVLSPRLEQAKLMDLFRDLEMPLVPVLARVEMNGVGLDTAALRDLSKEVSEQLADLEALCYKEAGQEFNINSPQQLGRILFEELGLPQIKKTKKRTAYSTDMSVLTILAQQHPLPEAVLNYRSLNKLLSTYIDVLPTMVNPETGRLHTSFNQAVTATGRLSSSDPNLQNIPVRSDLGRRIRACFVPKPDCLMLSADYSQIELRVLAHLSGDELLVSDLAGGLDVHSATAARIFNLEPDEVTSDQRRFAKTVNFGLLYGMTAFRLARELGIDRAEAEDIIERYLGRYQGIAAFQQENLAAARENGYVTTLLGRRRFLPAINSSDRTARQSAERMAMNTPIQGTAADIIKLAMLKVDAMIRDEYPDAAMILQVHDELVFEIAEDAIEAFSQRVRDIMENVVELKVKTKVDLGWGKNWNEAH